MAVFEAAFSVPGGHILWQVRSTPLARGPHRGMREWEHEEYDDRGVLLAVYESWTRGSGSPGVGGAEDILCWVKYSRYGWVLRRAGIAPIGRTGDVKSASLRAA